ncbi:hypothetical protein LZ32DRAFT_606993 [Colletotrichum eremochloae]|nr:hypothetical protein LZ32DRAFT_606993 [Colletotrichum eremochloae]
MADVPFAGRQPRLIPFTQYPAKSAHPNKKLDFCVYRTDYPGLLQRPIELSIMTKITGHDWAKAVKQIPSGRWPSGIRWMTLYCDQEAAAPNAAVAAA